MRVIVVQVLLNFIEREFQLTDISFLKALKVIKQKSWYSHLNSIPVPVVTARYQGIFQLRLGLFWISLRT